MRGAGSGTRRCKRPRRDSSRETGGAAASGTGCAARVADATARATARATAGATAGATLVVGHERAEMPQQPLNRQFGCWIPPVVALARFYGVGQHAAAAPVTVESVLALWGSDDEEADAVEVFELVAGEVMESLSVWSDDADFFKDTTHATSSTGASASSSTSINESDASEDALNSYKWMGPTSEEDFGTFKVSIRWFEDLRNTIDGGNPVLLLVQRLEPGKDRSQTHFLLCLGYEEKAGRRGRRAFTLYVKDPMEGDVMLAAPLWEEHDVELMTRQASGRPLDRYSILMSTHLDFPRPALSQMPAPQSY